MDSRLPVLVTTSLPTVGAGFKPALGPCQLAALPEGASVAPPEYDCAMKIGVIGAGVFGLASAIELRARGHAVTLFDQGTVPYEAASSTDVSKGIRRTWYAGDNETYVELVERAAEQWTRWEERSGTTFYHKVGGAYILDGMEPGSSMQASVDFLRSRGADISVLAAPEARDRFPQFRLADHELCVIDSWTGYIESARAVSFMCRLAGEEGVDVREQSAVAGVEERAGRVDIALDGGQRAGFDRVVVAVGVWIGRLLPDIGRHVRVTHQEMLLIEPADPGQFVAGTLPVWSVDPDREGWYGFPVLRGGYAKVAIDPPGDTVDPDLDRSGTPEFEERALAFLERRIPDLARGRVVGGRSCLYASHAGRPLHRRLGPRKLARPSRGRRERPRVQVRGRNRPGDRRRRRGRTQPPRRPLQNRQPLRSPRARTTAERQGVRQASRRVVGHP